VAQSQKTDSEEENKSRCDEGEPKKKQQEKQVNLRGNAELENGKHIESKGGEIAGSALNFGLGQSKEQRLNKRIVIIAKLGPDLLGLCRLTDERKREGEVD
jgi:hypothetical protein